MVAEKEKIKAIFETDLQKVLTKIGLIEKLNKSELLCKFCGEVITLDTLHSILPEAGTYNVLCSKPECAIRLAEYLENK